MPNKADNRAEQNAEFMGGPSFHPVGATIGDAPIRGRRIQPPSIAVPASVNDEPEVLFDGTTAVNSDLYDETKVVDARPASRSH